MCAEVEQRASYGSQPTTFSWHQIFFCCGSCQKQKVHIPSLQRGLKPPAHSGFYRLWSNIQDLTGTVRARWLAMCLPSHQNQRISSKSALETAVISKTPSCKQNSFDLTLELSLEWDPMFISNAGLLPGRVERAAKIFQVATKIAMQGWRQVLSISPLSPLNIRHGLLCCFSGKCAR